MARIRKHGAQNEEANSRMKDLPYVSAPQTQKLAPPVTKALFPKQNGIHRTKTNGVIELKDQEHDRGIVSF